MFPSPDMSEESQPEYTRLRKLIKTAHRHIEANENPALIEEKLRIIDDEKKEIEKRIASSMEEQSSEEDTYELLVINDEINDLLRLYKK